MMTLVAKPVVTLAAISVHFRFSAVIRILPTHSGNISANVSCTVQEFPVVWDFTIDRTFCLLCLERWEEALAAAEEALRWLRVDRGRKEKYGSQYTPFHLLPIYLALAQCRANPSPENEREAKKRLALSELKVRLNHQRHGALLYIFELWSRSPDLLK
jgi:hypothetical protein